MDFLSFGNDLILAGVGNNTIFGGIGNDTIWGAGGNNYINLESGSDYVVAEGGNNTIIGGTGNDTIYSGDDSSNWADSFTTANNYIYGGAGNSIIYGSGGNDTLIGGTGDATIFGGNGNEYIVAGDGNVSVNGGNGNDTIYAGNGNDIIWAGDGNTTIYGGNGTDTILGGAGTDVIFAGDGGVVGAETQVWAGDGTSTIYGGAGVDRLIGGAGFDTLIAGTGTGTLQGGTGTEVMYSSIGNATLVAGSGSDTLYGGGGADVLKGSSGNTLFVAGSGNETIIGGTGTNTYEFDAGFGNVELKTAQSTDTFRFGSGISVADLTVTATTGGNGNAALLIQTSSGGQLIIDDGLNGAVSNFNFANGSTLSLDQLLANSTCVESTIIGGNGNSSIFGGNGNSTLVGGTGSNTFYAHGSDNTIVVTNSSDVINTQPNSVNNTVVAGVDFVLQDNVQNLTLIGTTDLTAAGNSQNNVITANSGNDTLIGGGGNDTLIGGAGLDTFSMGSNMGQDTVTDASSQGAIIQLQPDIALGDLLATRQGNDLLLQIDTSDSMLIQGYYTNPQTSWTIQDANGNTTTPQAVLQTMAQLSEVDIAEKMFINQAEAAIRSYYPTNGTYGYTLQADGSFSRQVLIYPARAYDSVNNTTSTTTQYFFDSNGTISSSVTLPPVSYATHTWTPDSYYWYSYVGPEAKLVGETISISRVSTTSDASVVYADSWSSFSSRSLGYQWFNMSWESTYGHQTASGNYYTFSGYIFQNGYSYNQYATGLGALLGYQETNNAYTTALYFANGTPVGSPLASPGSLTTSGPFPQALQSLYYINQTNFEIQTISLDGTSGQTVYANFRTVVNSNSGNDIIYDAGFAYGGSGNDTMIGGGTLMAGTGNDLLEYGSTMIAGTGNDTLIGGNTMIAGSGNDQIFAGSSAATIQIDPNVASNDLIGGAGDANQFLNAVYQSMGITDVQQSQEYGGMYAIGGEFGDLPFGQGGGYVFYFTYDQISSLQGGDYQWLADYISNNPQWITYIQPLPSLDIPAANDFQALASYYAQGIIPQHTVTFGPGVSLSDLSFSWGETTGSVSGLPTDPQLRYTTLNISWGANNQSIQVMIPHSDDLIGSGTSQFTFADGSVLSMADMIAKAPAAPSFDPQIFQYQPGIGVQVLGSGYSSINFGYGITAGNAQFVLSGSDLHVTVGKQGDNLLIQGFAPNGAAGNYSIGPFQFADGSQGAYVNDGQGNASLNAYDTNGRLTGDFWQHSDGSSGNDTYNPDGSSSGTGYNSDGSYCTYTDDGHGSYNELDYATNGNLTGSYTGINDGLGNSTWASYDANGIKLNDWWGRSDGTSGNDTFNADGSSSGTTYNADGYSSYTNDGHSDITTTYFDVSGVELSDTWYKADGSHGSDVFNADGTSSGTSYNADSSYSSYTYGYGDITTTNYDASGIKLSDSWIKFDGTLGSDTFNADGSYSSYFDYVQYGYAYTNYYDANGNLTGDSYQNADGSHGTDAYNADGSSRGTWYNADGSYYTYTQDASGNDYVELDYAANGSLTGSYTYTSDGLGNYSDVYYDANGNKLSDDWGKADGTYGSDVFNADGSSSGTCYNADGSYSSYVNDGIGDVTTTSFDANGNETGYSMSINDGLGNTTIANYDVNANKLSDSWVKADGTHGADVFNADGSSSGTTYQVNGSYTNYIKDVNGNISLSNFDANGNPLTGYSTTTIDGSGNTTTTNYDANGNKLGDSWTQANGTTGSDTFNVGGVSGVNESKVIYTYADGSTYATDTIYDPNGSYQQSTVKGDGSTTSTDYNAATGEVIGSVATAGAGYSYTYDNTVNVNGVAGETESKVAYTYTDGSTYSTDTVYDPNGSYQQTTAKGDGSSTTTDYNATTGEVIGSVATAGAGYSYTYDNTVNVNGVAGETESKVAYTYTDGSTYSTDTVYDPNGSYQQTTAKGDGSTTTTDYNAATGEVIGSVATAGAGYSYTYDNTVNVNGVAGETESKVTYTYADNSTYSTDTIYDPNGSYQQSTVKGDGSTTTTDYNAVTGEVIGSVATAGAGYSYTYDNTVNVNGVAGETESKVAYTYADGSTYATDTIYDPNGSYQQSTAKGDGSTATTDYNAATGEVIGSVATAGAGYSYTYDNTVNVNGVAGETESKVAYTYADGSTYGTDTVYDPNGSYQQSTVKGDGSTTTTDYNAVTGEVIGSVATAGAGYSYTYDNTQNVNGVSGETESKVTYTYADNSTYSTDTVYDPNGSYQQSTVKGDGSTTTTDYNAATGEVIGSVATAGAGYSYTYDNTVNVNGVAGETESKVAYTYTDGSTYSTDTVYDPNGSYQQTTAKGDGSTTTTDYNAATGEVIGSVATAGAGYSYTYDNTVNVNGVDGETESKVNYTYTDGSTYSTDTVSNPDSSYFQSWSKSDGTAGSVAVNANGTLAGDSWVHADGNQGVDAGGNHLIMSGSASDSLAATTGNDILIGGAGNDTLTTGAGTNLIAFNQGDGQDIVNAAAGQNNTISLGGYIAFSDLALQKNGNDLVLDVGASDSITFKNWYAGAQNIVNLQVIASAMSDFNPGSTDVLRNSNVENFDFQQLVAAFDQAQAANPSLNAWGVTNDLLNAHLASSDTAALGGDLAYVYGTQGSLTGFNVAAAENSVSNTQFAAAPQTLNPWPTLNTGTAQIR